MLSSILKIMLRLHADDQKVTHALDNSQLFCSWANLNITNLNSMQKTVAADPSQNHVGKGS